MRIIYYTYSYISRAVRLQVHNENHLINSISIRSKKIVKNDSNSVETRYYARVWFMSPSKKDIN